MAHRHLFRLLRTLAPSEKIARRTLLAWVTGNAFLGAQLSWILRPFFGSPSLEVAFLREDPMQGTFYEAVWNSLTRILPLPLALFLLLLGGLFGVALLRRSFLTPTPPSSPAPAPAPNTSNTTHHA